MYELMIFDLFSMKKPGSPSFRVSVGAQFTRKDGDPLVPLLAHLARCARGDALGHLLAAPPHAQDHILVDQGGQDGADDRPDPVDQVIVPEAASQGWAEG